MILCQRLGAKKSVLELPFSVIVGMKVMMMMMMMMMIVVIVISVFIKTAITC